MARVLCSTHGIGGAFSVSPDHGDWTLSAFARRARRFTVFDEFGVIESGFVSPEYATLHAVPEEPTELPAQFPEWYAKLTVVCSSCLVEAQRR